jgi:hypothetical protein
LTVDSRGNPQPVIDRVLPHFHHSEYHATRIRATPERIYAIVRHGRLPVHPIVRVLVFLRGLGRKGDPTFSIDRVLRQGFSLIAEDPPRELVLGLEGPFWSPTCKLRPLDEASFLTPVPRGSARGAWNFLIHADGTVSTETRVLCAEDARKKFAAYWLFVRPFSGLIRRMMLRAIRIAAERPA